MIKIIIVLLSVMHIFASNIEILGSKSISKGNITTIEDGMLFKNGMIVSAHKIVYNKKTNLILAEGNVYINYDKSDYILANKVWINLKNNAITANPFFFFSYKDNGWITAKTSLSHKNIYKAKTAISSTCSINNPDWKLEASSVDYNKQTKWIDLYNPRLYIKGIPILYLPYLGFSLDKTRSSGFLRPLFGYSANEGALITIPYYQTLGMAADLEIDPTIRTKRGKGIYTTFRFVHSPTSKGEFKIGEFKDNPDYTQEYNLLNQIHRGWSFLYTNRSIFSNSDKIYVDLKSANDTDYFYLDAYNYTFKSIEDKVLTSNINYYVKNNYNYLGIYAKYFQDTSKVSNADTMQVLPQVNYHVFNDNFWKKFSFSLDANVYNYTRKKGYKAEKDSIVIPLSYNDNFFDDYLKFGITEQANFNQVKMNDGNISKYYTLNTILKLYTNLSKKYQNFNHHIAPSITFNMNNSEYFNGVESEYLDKTSLQKSVTYGLNQYFIADNWSITDDLSQTYYLEDDAKNSSNILHSLDINYYDYYLNSKNRYAPSNDKFTYNSVTLGYNDNKYKLEYSRIYSSDINGENETDTYDIKGFWKYDTTHKLFGEYNYDLELNMQKFYNIGISMQKKCWKYSLSYKKETLPLLTVDGISSVIQKTVYFEIELIPLGGIKQQYQFKTKKAE